MTADQTMLVRIARAALADVESLPPIALAPVAGTRFRLPVPRAVTAAFLHRDIRRQAGHLLDLRRRDLALGQTPCAKDEADRLEALLKSIPEKPTGTLVLAAGLVLFLLALVYFSLDEIGTLLKITVAVFTLKFTDAYEAALKMGVDGLWWRFPLFLMLTYGPAHLVLMLGFWLKRRILLVAGAAVGAEPARDGVTPFDRLAADLQRAAGGASLAPAAFDHVSMTALYLGCAAALGGVVVYVAWLADSGVLLAAGIVNLLIGLGVAALSISAWLRARRSVTDPQPSQSRR